MCPAKSNTSKAQAETHIVDTQSKETSSNLTSESKQPSECAYRVSISMNDAEHMKISPDILNSEDRDGEFRGLTATTRIRIKGPLEHSIADGAQKRCCKLKIVSIIAN